MKRLFDPDSPFIHVLSDLADLVILNLLWLLCCLPVVTAGASTAALYRCTLNMAYLRGGRRARAFFTAFRENFRQATLLWLILLAVLALLLADAWLVYQQAIPYAFSFLVGPGLVIWAFAAAYVFPLCAQFENTLGGTLKNALVFSSTHPLRSLLMILLDLLPLLLYWLSPAAFLPLAPCWLLFASAVTAYVNCLLLKKVFAPYLPPQEDN